MMAGTSPKTSHTMAGASGVSSAPINAERVAEFGAGIALEMTPEGLGRLGAAVRELLENSRYRSAAQEVADEMAALPLVDESVKLLEALAGNRSGGLDRLNAVA
jgi:UDP:flavonoid glycosyltransferase YjiC (YdhE family)